MKRSVIGGLATLAVLILLGSAAAPTASASTPRDKVVGDRCQAPANARMAKGGNPWADPNTLTRNKAAAIEAQTQRIINRSGIGTRARPNGSVKISVHFHGVTDRAGHGFVTKRRFKRQIEVLNKAYAGRTGPNAANTPFRFRLASIDRTKNNRWYNADFFTKQGRKALREMRRTLRVGDARDLNIYTASLNDRLLGFATLPGEYKKFPKLDGVVLLSGSLPGGNAVFGPDQVYNRGDTATHEIGHWLNLYHTFQGGCGHPNDYVTDTPAQKADDNVFVCDPTLNTCPPFTNASRDPVKNFMNYVDDPCMNQFTQGQRDRMDNGWRIRRALSH
jgi:Pregnancy-associated plasma protein-A